MGWFGPLFPLACGLPPSIPQRIYLSRPADRQNHSEYWSLSVFRSNIATHGGIAVRYPAKVKILARTGATEFNPRVNKEHSLSTYLLIPN